MSKINVEADISSGKWNVSDLDINDMEWQTVSVNFYFIDDDSAESGIVNIAGMEFGCDLIHEGEVIETRKYPPEGHMLLDHNIFATDNPILEIATLPVEEGKRYTLKIWYKMEGSNIDRFMSVDFINPKEPEYWLSYYQNHPDVSAEEAYEINAIPEEERHRYPWPPKGA